MKISEAKALMSACIDHKVYVPQLYVGTMGIGKSQMVKQIAAEKGFDLVDLRLATQEPGDLIGLPRMHKETARTIWLKPAWWPEEGTSGILFLDEMNRAPVDVRQAVFQLILDRQLHTHKLPDGWFIFAAVNPDNGNYQVEQLDPAMVRRFCTIKLVSDIDEWAKYWHNRYPDDEDAELIAKFVLANKGLMVLKEDFDIETKPTPDGYRMVYEMLKAAPVELEAEVVRGLIGNEASIAFLKFKDKNYLKPVGGKEILTEYKKVKDKLHKQEKDAMYVTLHDLIAIVGDGKKINKSHVDNLAQFLTEADEESKATVLVKLPDTLIHKLSNYPDLLKAIKKVLDQLNKKRTKK